MEHTETILGEDILYTVSKVASLLKVNRNMVYDLINQGYLRSIKFGCRKVTRKALLDFLEQHDGEELPLISQKKEAAAGTK